MKPKFFKIALLVLLLNGQVLLAHAQTRPLSERMAATVMTLYKEREATAGKSARWSYEQGVMMKGIEGVWRNTSDKNYLDLIQQAMDRFIDDDGTIRTYKLEDYNIDN